MITQLVIGLGTSFAGWVGGLFPAWTPPDWLMGSPKALQAFLEGASGLGVWVDWAAVATCVGTVIGVWVLTFGIKLVRAIAAHIPAVGGAG